MKDNWDKIRIIGILLIPIILAILGWNVDNSFKESDIKMKYIEIAIDILRDKPKEETTSLRLWAMKVISQYSLVKFDDNALNELKKYPLPKYNILLDVNGEPIFDVNGKPITILSP